MKLNVQRRLRLLVFLVSLLGVVTAGVAVPAAPAASAQAMAHAGVTLAPSYLMHFDNLTYSTISDGSLTSMSVKSGSVSGYMTVNPPLYGTGPVSGTLNGVTITFTGTGGSKYTGTVDASTLQMSGTYTYPGQSGIWNATPASRCQINGTCPQNSSDCDATQVPSPASQPVSGSVPVLFVHGLDSSPSIWDQGPGIPIADQVAALKGVTAWTYDYSKVAVQWVTDPQIGLGLADAITCLAQSTGNQVIVVAHSMGGLATQWAVNQTGTDGVPVANHVAKVITIGTPTKGSLSGAIAVEGTAGIEDAVSALGGLEGKALVAGVEAARSACAGAVIKNPQADPCLWFGLDETPAGKALLYGSPELAALPPWPTSLPVVAMAGNFSEDISVGGISTNVPLGDLIVSLGSATAYDTSGPPFVVTCPNVTVLGLLLQHDDELCYHHNLPHDPQIEAAVLAQIRASVSTAASSTPSPTPSTSSPDASRS
jgi:pimeloyl-ACP methyl ester carboxylesterase